MEAAAFPFLGPAHDDSPLPAWQKGLIGGLGAMTPVIMNLLVVDLEGTFRDSSILVLLGYLLRVSVLFYLGALVAFLHKDERSIAKLFELGVVAPALVTAYLNGAPATVRTLQGSVPTPTVVSFLGISEAEAQTAARRPPPGESPAQRLWRGFIGSPVDRANDGPPRLSRTETEQRLREINELRRRGLLSEPEAAHRRKEVLDRALR